MESQRATHQGQQEEVQKYDKKIELIRVKLEMEAKLKEDLSELKRRLEKELEDSEKFLEQETNKRKAAEEDNWRLRTYNPKKMKRKLKSSLLFFLFFQQG